MAAIASLVTACMLACAQIPANGVATDSGWKLSTVLGPAYPQGRAGERWAALIVERSGGRLAVRHHPGATLFHRDASREFIALREGSIAFAVGSSLAWARYVSALDVIALPWMVPDERALEALLASPVSAELSARIEAMGIVVVAWAPNGFSQIASKRPLRAPADVEGLRVRTAGLPLPDQTLARLGATTLTMNAADARAAALAGGLDAEETKTSVYRASSAAAAGFTHLQLWDAHADALIFAVNAQVWNALNDADRALVRQAARDAAAEAVALRRQQTGETALAEMARQGTAVTRLTAAGKQAFRDAARPVYERWVASIGAELVHQAEAAIAASAGTR